MPKRAKAIDRPALRPFLPWVVVCPTDDHYAHCCSRQDAREYKREHGCPQCRIVYDPERKEKPCRQG